MSVSGFNCPFCNSWIEVRDQPATACPSCGKTLHASTPKSESIKNTAEIPSKKSSTPHLEPLHPTALTASRMLGPYRIERSIGQGGMGFVYEALDTRLNRRVALKMMETSEDIDEKLITRFRQEAMHSAKLRHPHIVPVHDIGSESGFDYFTMDLVEGITLDTWLKKTESTLRTRIEIIEKIAQALHYAHQQGVIHRDVKPGNIMIDATGEPLIMDFGLARNIAADQHLTVAGHIVGTPAYMAPEQTAGITGEITSATDVWGLGVILYEMLAGKSPFNDGNVYQTIYAILHQDPEPPRKVDKNIPPDLETIILKCLEKQPKTRYSTAKALADDLRAWLEGRPIGARKARWWNKIGRRRKAISLNEFMLEQQARQRADTERLELEQRLANENKQEWHLVFEDDFSDADVESRWEIVGENWKLVNGQLKVWGGLPQVLYLRKPVTGDVRFEFECHQDGEYLGDISCFLSAIPLLHRKKACETGYMFQYGANANTKNFIERPQKVIWEQLGSPIVKEVSFRVSVEKCDSRLTWRVNDALICEIEDSDPLVGTDRNSIGIYGWLANTYYHWVKIYTLGSPIKSDVLMIAQKQMQRGKFESAIHLFEEILESTDDPIRRSEARNGIELAQSRLELQRMLPACLAKVTQAAPNGRVELGEDGLVITANSSKLGDLEFIKDIPVNELGFRHNSIQRLDPLAKIPTLVRLDLSHNKISDLSPLSQLNLDKLNISYNPIRGLEPLKLSSLRILDAAGCGLSDISSLAGNQLTWLSLEQNQIKSLEPLRGSPLKSLHISHNQIKDLSPLRGMPLNAVSISGNQVTNFDDFEGIPLNSLVCEQSLITSFGPMIKRPPYVFFYNDEGLSTAEMERAITAWKSKGLNVHAQNAEALLALRQRDIQALKKLATKFGDHSYLFIPKFVNFAEAKRITEDLGGFLVTLRSEEEAKFIRTIQQRAQIWLGLTREHGECRWITGEPVSADELVFLERGSPKKISESQTHGTLSVGLLYVAADEPHRLIIKWPV